MSEPSLLDRRRIEASLIAQIYDVLAARLDEPGGLAIIGEAIEADAEAAGKAFAEGCEGPPTLAHFATVLERWRQGGALEITDVRRTADVLEFRVTRCAYVELYVEIGLPARLAYTLSCRRDAAFARGYHPGLVLERSPTLAEGSAACRFRFQWTPA